MCADRKHHKLTLAYPGHYIWCHDKFLGISQLTTKFAWMFARVINSLPAAKTWRQQMAINTRHINAHALKERERVSFRTRQTEVQLII